MCGRMLLKVGGCLMLGLFMLWRSFMMCKARECGPPDLAHYATHFPAIIPNLIVFVREQHQKQAEMGISGSSGNHTIIQSKRSRSSRRKSMKRPGRNKSSDGLYVLDIYSRWDKRIEVWSVQADEINMVLQPGEAWTQELKQYATRKVVMTASWEHKIRERPRLNKLAIRIEPFGGLVTQSRLHSNLIQILKNLPCRLFRLSRWVFDAELGAFAVIYVQATKENLNLVARLALVHVPRDMFELATDGLFYKHDFSLWIYQKPTDSTPVLEGKIDLQKLVASLESLAHFNSHHVKVVSLGSQLPPPNQDHPYTLPFYEDPNSYNQTSSKCDRIEVDVPCLKDLEARDIEAAYILESLKHQPVKKDGQ